MSIVAIEAISNFLHKREVGVSVAEIKEKIRAYVEWREERDTYHIGGKTRSPRSNREQLERKQYVREGRVIEAEKVR